MKKPSQRTYGKYESGKIKDHNSLGRSVVEKKHQVPDILGRRACIFSINTVAADPGHIHKMEFNPAGAEATDPC